MEGTQPVFAPLAPEDPREVGGYRILARLGAGGMGRVYLAATQSGRRLAVKLVRPEFCDDPEFRRRFQQEVAAAQRVHSLYTAPLVDADPNGPHPWLATAYVPGPSLADVVTAHGPMPADTVRRLTAGVAEALHAIHAAGVIHRDLKPSNVLVADDGPRVIDFGIARAADATPLTRTGFRIGSPHYMSPEQALGHPSTPAIDVFALGSMAYFAASGRAAFGDGPESAVLYRVVHEEPNLEGCPPELRPLIERCLAKEPGDRPSPSEIVTSCAVGGGQPGWLPPDVTARLTHYADPPLPPAVPPPFDPRAGRPTYPGQPPVPGVPTSPARRGPAHGERRVLIGAAAAIALIMLIVLVAVVSRGGDGRSAARNHAPSTGSARPSQASQASQPSPADSNTTVAAGSKPPGSLLGTYRHISLPDYYGISFTDDPKHPRQYYHGDLRYSAGMVEAHQLALLRPGQAGSYETCRDDTQYTSYLQSIGKGQLICVTTDTGLIGLVKVTDVESDPSQFMGFDLTVWQGPPSATQDP